VKTTIQFWSYLAHSFLEREMFQMKVVEEIKTRILCSIFFLNRASVLLYRYIACLVWKVVSLSELS